MTPSVLAESMLQLGCLQGWPAGGSSLEPPLPARPWQGCWRVGIGEQGLLQVAPENLLSKDSLSHLQSQSTWGRAGNEWPDPPIPPPWAPVPYGYTGVCKPPHFLLPACK